MILDWLLGKPEPARPNGSRLSEERNGRLFVPGHRPLERNPTRRIEVEVAHLLERIHAAKPAPMPKLQGIAKLIGCSIGRHGRDEEISLPLQFSAYPDGRGEIVFGVLENDGHRGSDAGDVWWIECHVTPVDFARMQSAAMLRIGCTADMWQSGRHWKLARTLHGPVPGRGSIGSIAVSA